MQLPPLAQAPRFPAAGALVLASTVLTLLAWRNPALGNALAMDPRAFGAQPWRLVTSALIHVDVMHLVFNLGWTWGLCTFLESRLGAARMLAVVAVFAAGSAAFEYAFLEGGIGLSGVVYGLATMLFVLGRREPRYAGVIDRRSAQLLAGWFVLCVALTVANVWRVANLAHGSGAVLGALLGVAIGARGGRRVAAVTAMGGLLVVGVVASTVARPRINFAANAGDDVERLGLVQLEAAANAQAARTLSLATSYRHPPARRFYNLGIAYQRLGRKPEAERAYRRAVALSPSSAGYRRALTACLEDRAYVAFAAGRAAESEALYRECVAVLPTEASCHANLGALLMAAGRGDEALASLQRAFELEPEVGDHRADLANGYRALGSRQIQAQNYEAAIAHDERCLALVPAHAGCLYDKGLALYHLGRFAEAEAALSRARALDPALPR